MKHNIIVKFIGTVTDKAAMIDDIKSLFSSAAAIPGVHGYKFHHNCVDRPNRYDLMIVVELDRDALSNWDESELHKRWLSDYGGYVGAKAIFDYI